MADQVLDFFCDREVVEDPFPYYEFARAQRPVWQESHHGCFIGVEL